MNTFTVPATRAAGLARLAQFAPQAGRHYAAERNSDHGPGRHDRVSGLSPWLRHRLLTEDEVLRRVLAQHSQDAAAKFIEEVFWRGYFKGYLESHPSIWNDYRRTVVTLLTQRSRDSDLAQAYAQAVDGATGVDCFDAWVAELKNTGYLHNHARMWFASIWIFTLQLPWQLGADFTYRHFIDGDAAANTLGWRWVAGLHTRGKHYLAQADNIARYTGGRFAPQGLVLRAPPLSELTAHPLVSLALTLKPPRGPVALLLTDEDGLPETLGLEPTQVVAVAGAAAFQGRSPLHVGPLLAQFSRGALQDALLRASAHFSAPSTLLAGLDGDAIAEWAARTGVQTIVTAAPAAGPVQEMLADARDWLSMRNLRLVTLNRRYDAAVWPLATQGYSALRNQIPALIERLALESGRPEQGTLL